MLPCTAPLFRAQLESMIEEKLIAKDSFILFCNDGSTDETWPLLVKLSEENIAFQALSLSRNRGHQNVVLAGLMQARILADVAISIDCDGQDDLSAMTAMLKKYHEGFDIVYGVRSKRDTDSAFKRNTAQAFYKFLNLMGVEAVYNHADYRLMSKRALDALSEFGEVNLFLRGMVPLLGFPSTQVLYERHERIAGESHYPLSKMLTLATGGITSLSIRPIRIISVLGFCVTLISFIAVIWAIVVYFSGKTASGWASTITLLSFLSGIQILSIGVIGEYVGRTYLETKQRPRYIIAQKTYVSPDEPLRPVPNEPLRPVRSEQED